MGRKKKVILEGPEEKTDQVLKSGGLGDFIATITEAVGIEPCGACDRRKDAFNKAFPWLRPTREVQDSDIEFMKVIKNSRTIQNDDVNELFRLYNELFKSKLIRCNCPGLVSKMVDRLNTYING